jgi:hypothetical protein
VNGRLPKPHDRPAARLFHAREVKKARFLDPDVACPEVDALFRKTPVGQLKETRLHSC